MMTRTTRQKSAESGSSRRGGEVGREREKTRIRNWDDAFTIRPEKPRTAVAVAGNVCAPPQVPLMRGELPALLLLMIQRHVLGEL